MFLTARVLLLLFAFYESNWTNIASNRMQDQGQTRIEVQWVNPRQDKATELGDAFAKMYIPAFGQDYQFAIVEGVQEHELRTGPGHYPGTCRDLSDAQRQQRRTELAQQGRIPALRLRADVREFPVVDSLHGCYVGDVDDMILRRGGNATQIGPNGLDWAYNLAVVVDDAHQGVDQVVRGDDLLPSTPRQAYLASLLGYPIPEYVHVPLVINEKGERLAKRDGAVTLREMLQEMTVVDVVQRMAASLGIAAEGVETAHDVLQRFDPAQLSGQPYIFMQWPMQ